jgi:hypothetical protein
MSHNGPHRVGKGISVHMELSRTPGRRHGHLRAHTGDGLLGRGHRLPPTIFALSAEDHTWTAALFVMPTYSWCQLRHITYVSIAVDSHRAGCTSASTIKCDFFLSFFFFFGRVLAGHPPRFSVHSARRASHAATSRGIIADPMANGIGQPNATTVSPHPSTDRSSPIRFDGLRAAHGTKRFRLQAPYCVSSMHDGNLSSCIYGRII